jgi:hypothetical protein
MTGTTTTDTAARVRALRGLVVGIERHRRRQRRLRQSRRTRRPAAQRHVRMTGKTKD